MTIHFYEIDQDGRGDNTWVAQTDHAQFLRSYEREVEMLNDAAICSVGTVQMVVQGLAER